MLSAQNLREEDKRAEQEKEKNRIKRFPRAYVQRAHSNSNVVFLLSQVSHPRRTSEEKKEEILQNAEEQNAIFVGTSSEI